MSQSSFSHRILIVDDEPAIRERGELLLERQGYEVITARDGFEALLALKDSLPDLPELSSASSIDSIQDV